MIPAKIEAHLRERHGGFQHHTHATAMTAQALAAAEHVSGYRVAKPVVVKLDDRLAIAVVAATDHLRLEALERATGARAALAPETEFSQLFQPCDPGAEPPFALFGVPLFVDEKLVSERQLVMPAGTHEDAVVLDTAEWIRCEQPRAIRGLGVLASAGARPGEQHA